MPRGLMLAPQANTSTPAGITLQQQINSTALCILYLRANIRVIAKTGIGAVHGNDLTPGQLNIRQKTFVTTQQPPFQ